MAAELVRGSSRWRQEVWGEGCDTSRIIAVHWMMGGPKIQCNKGVVTAFRALGRIMYRYRYVARSGVTGCYNCRVITGGTAPSSHAQGIAIDVNWDTNPYRRDRMVTDMGRDMIEAIEALRTDKGAKVFRWGGDWDGRPETPHSNYDAMHIETVATPDELRAGFSIPDFDPDNRWAWPYLAEGEKGMAVRRLQSSLNAAMPKMEPLKADGFFGGFTGRRVSDYQSSRGLVPDGQVGLGTWTALLTAQPLVTVAAESPHKSQATDL